MLYSIWMQLALDYTATWAGIAIAGSGIPPMLLMTYIGRRIYRLNLRGVILVGSAAIMGGLYLQAQMNTQITMTYIFLTRMLMGAGLGVLFAPLMSLSLIGVPQEKTASAAGS